MYQEIQDLSISPPVDNDSSSLAKRRSRRVHRRLPKRFRDLLPEAPPSLPSAESIPRSTLTPPPQSDNTPFPIPDHNRQANPPTTDPCSRVFKYFHTVKNLFGLSRRYFAPQFPTHDPDQSTTLTDLCNNPVVDEIISNNQHTSIQPSNSAFYPYPNENSFRLGHWYWNGSVQKSQESFKELLDIVADPGFDPSHIQNTRWDQINAKLAGNEIEDDDEWMDVDAGWKKKSISIPVPFHDRTHDPGVHQYICGELHYRSLVDVIKEKLTNAQDCEQFHLEPYELLWNPTDQDRDIRVHGELYNSPSFFEAHCALQDSPGEPNCDLPRVVVGLMFWSDSTHLTSFGNSKLWPCYLYFGNESKYRRCKPSSHLCNHVAYFQKVSLCLVSLCIFHGSIP